MPKTSLFPVHSIDSCLALTKCVYKNNGETSLQDCAKSLKKTISGPFLSLVASSVKFGLITHKKEQIKTTPIAHSLIANEHNPSIFKKTLKACIAKLTEFNTLIEKHSTEDKEILSRHIVNTHSLTPNQGKEIAKATIETTQFINALEKENPEENTAQINKDQTGKNSPEQSSEISYHLTLKGKDLSLTLSLDSIEQIALAESGLTHVKLQLLKK